MGPLGFTLDVCPLWTAFVALWWAKLSWNVPKTSKLYISFSLNATGPGFDVLVLICCARGTVGIILMSTLILCWLSKAFIRLKSCARVPNMISIKTMGFLEVSKTFLYLSSAAVTANRYHQSAALSPVTAAQREKSIFDDIAASFYNEMPPPPPPHPATTTALPSRPKSALSKFSHHNSFKSMRSLNGDQVT